MKNLLYALFWLCVLGVVACHKEPHNPINPEPAPCDSTISWTPVLPDTCFDLPFTPTGFVLATLHLPVFKAPHFCPFNAHQFVYLNIDYDSTAIYRADACSGDKQLIVKTLYTSLPQWGEKDWILFKLNTILHKVKSNGDSLSVVSSDEGISDYYWINDAEAIQVSWRDNSVNFFDFIMTPSGEIIDTIPYLIGTGVYRNGKIFTKLVNSPVRYLGLVNTTTWQFTPLMEIDSSPSLLISTPAWLDDHTVVWVNLSGIYKMDIQTTQVTTIKETPCQNLKYYSIAAAPDGSGRLLTSRLEYVYVTPDSLVEYQRISMLDTFTGQEWILGLED